METQEVFSAARPSAPASYQSSGNLAASACKYLRMARWPGAPLAAHHRIRHPKKRGGGSQSGARDWILGACTFGRTSPSSPVSVLKLISQAGWFIMLKMSLGQFFVHIYGLKVNKVHKSVVNFAPSLSVRRHSSAFFLSALAVAWLFCATFAVG